MRTFHPPSTTTHVDPVHRALEGIKDKLQLLSENSGADERSEKEPDMIAVCDLVDDFRDTILDYLVSSNVGMCTPDSALMQLIALTAEGNLQSNLYTDRKS